MRSRFMMAVTVLLAFGLGVAITLLRARPSTHPPDPPVLIERIRDVARLETLEVTLYKKVSLEPQPEPADSLWGEVANFARFTLNAPHGKAIIFAVAHLGLDLSRLQVSSVRSQGDQIQVLLPPVKVQVELKPADTEVIGSNLDSAQTAQLFELARKAMEREVSADPHLNERAKASAQRAVRALLITLGYRDVQFVDAFPVAGAG